MRRQRQTLIKTSTHKASTKIQPQCAQRIRMLDNVFNNLVPRSRQSHGTFHLERQSPSNSSVVMWTVNSAKVTAHPRHKLVNGMVEDAPRNRFPRRNGKSGRAIQSGHGLQLQVAVADRVSVVSAALEGLGHLQFEVYRHSFRALQSVDSYWACPAAVGGIFSARALGVAKCLWCLQTPKPPCPATGQRKNILTSSA